MRRDSGVFYFKARFCFTRFLISDFQTCLCAQPSEDLVKKLILDSVCVTWGLRLGTAHEVKDAQASRHLTAGRGHMGVVTRVFSVALTLSVLV